MLYLEQLKASFANTFDGFRTISFYLESQAARPQMGSDMSECLQDLRHETLALFGRAYLYFRMQSAKLHMLVF